MYSAILCYNNFDKKGCSHLMSVRYFLSSVNNCTFKAYYCRTQNDFFSNVSKCHKSAKNETKAPPRMGYYADMSADTFKKSYGNFFLNTTGHAPFCQRVNHTSNLVQKHTRHFLFN